MILTVDKKIRDAFSPLSDKTKLTIYSELMEKQVSELTEAQIELLFALSLDPAIQNALYKSKK
jgi:hypothetical protein